MASSGGALVQVAQQPHTDLNQAQQLAGDASMRVEGQGNSHIEDQLQLHCSSGDHTQKGSSAQGSPSPSQKQQSQPSQEPTNSSIQQEGGQRSGTGHTDPSGSKKSGAASSSSLSQKVREQGQEPLAVGVGGELTLNLQNPSSGMKEGLATGTFRE